MDACLLQALGELDHLWCAIELSTLGKTSCPGEDGGDGVRRGRIALLVLAVVASDSAVCCLSFERLAIWSNQNGCHETQRAKSLSNNVGLNITIVVYFLSVFKPTFMDSGQHTLHGNDHAALVLDHLSNHIVNKTVLVPQTLRLEVLLVILLVDLLENVLELAIIGLQDGVLGGHVHRVVERECVLERGVCKALDTLDGVVLCLSDTSLVLVGELKDQRPLRLTTLGRVHHFKLAWSFNDSVLCAVLVTMGVTTDHDRFLPARNKAGYPWNDNWFSKHSASENVTNCAIWRQPHLLELKLFHTLLIWRDGRALHTHAVLLDRLRSIRCDLIICLITLLQAKIVVLEIDVQVWVNEFVLDVLPDDPGHLVAIKLDDGVLDLDLRNL